MKILSITLIFIISVSCTHKAFRSGYRFGETNRATPVAVIKKNMVPNDSLNKVGEIKLTDGWWVVSCNEAHAMKILEKEAHQLRADVINIIHEKRPGIKSSCYQCEAAFYQYKNDRMKITGDTAYTADNIKARVKKDKKRNAVIGTASVAVGIATALVLLFVFVQ